MPGGQLKGWERNTSWRQGHVLDAHAVAALGFGHEGDVASTVVMVISHDCDIASDNLAVEPDVEVIVGKLLPGGPDGNFAWGKSPRTLHLQMLKDGAEATVQLVTTNKCMVPKTELAQYEPASEFFLDGRGLGVLRSWLSARYNRSAFSDAFVNRMKSTDLESKLAKTIEPHGALISFVNFDIDEGEVVERSDGDPYSLGIVLVYPPGDDPDAAADAAEAVVESVEKICEKCLKDGAQIVLKRCIAISEDDISISQSRLLMQWRFEHMTNKADGHPGPVR